MPSSEILTQRKILKFWSPLAATWLMMAVEGPYLAAIIARLPEAKLNLAAYGIAYALALVIEAPVIMLLSASTALVTDRQSFLKLRRFTYALSAFITILMLLIISPPTFHFISKTIMDLPDTVADLTHQALIFLIPWPAAIGYRRFYQGILIRNNLTRRVAYGTVIRLLTMSLCAFLLFRQKTVAGAYVGAAALSLGVVCEAIASRLMVYGLIKKIKADEIAESSTNDRPTYRSIWIFYYPLMLTSLMGLAVQPLVTFFVGHSRLAIESLAVLPVANSLVFLFRSLGLSYQEVSVALLGRENKNYPALRRFAIVLSV